MCVVISSIAIFSNYNTIINFVPNKDIGVSNNPIELERYVSNEINWSFESTQEVKLLIIKKSTLESLQERASMLSTFPGLRYEDLMKKYLKDHYVSYNQLNDLGRFFPKSPGMHYIMFDTTGIFKYSFKYDPFFIDLMWFLYGMLCVAIIIGIVITVSRILNMVLISQNDKKYDSALNVQMDKYCDRCGILLELNSLFCHECGIKLNIYK